MDASIECFYFSFVIDNFLHLLYLYFILYVTAQSIVTFIGHQPSNTRS